MIGFIIGIILASCGCVYAVTAVIESKEVSYDNSLSGGGSTTVQGSIDELYKKAKALSGEGDSIYTEDILHGADPVLKDKMIPVTIDDDGTVKYASRYSKWYCYKAKKWANAVLLVSNPSQDYKTGQEIAEKDIQSYFVWIPRYKYRIWDLGKYSGYYQLSQLQDTEAAAPSDPTALRHITGKARLIDVVFESKSTAPSTTEAVDQYYTHPAFTNFDVNGLWVGKFEISKSGDNIQVKPGVSSWRSQTVGTFWNTLFQYNRDLDSHMMKNTEWGAAAYLSHSIYGIGSEININNNSSYLTGYSAAANTDQSSYQGTYGTAETITQPYNTATGFLATTTGNISGIYDMSGGAHEYMASYRDGQNASTSGLSSELTTYSKYFDKYDGTSSWTSYDKRILGDATGEMGPFYYYYDKDKYKRVHNIWYADYSYFVDSTYPWFLRGGGYSHGVLAGQFNFYRYTGGAYGNISARLVLAD